MDNNFNNNNINNIEVNNTDYNDPYIWEEPFNPNDHEDIYKNICINNKIKINDEPLNLYRVIEDNIEKTGRYSRIALIGKVKEEIINGKKLDREDIISFLISEIKSFNSPDIPNYFITIFNGQFDRFIAIILESSVCNLLDFAKNLNNIMNIDNNINSTTSNKIDNSSNTINVFESCNVIAYIEETKLFTLPKAFFYETNISEGVMGEYKSKNISQKAWIIYNYLCNFGKEISQIKKPNDENERKPIINNYLKYMPGSEDLKEVCNKNLNNLNDFVKQYCDVLDIELDEDIIWPYQWQLNL